jgi:hypothetical protein
MGKNSVRTKDRTFIGYITDLNFEYDDRIFFYIVDEDGEDYQIADTEVLAINPVRVESSNVQE